MTPIRVLSFDLDDTLWPVAPVMLAAEAQMWAWLRSQHAELLRDHDVQTLRSIRARVEAQFPERSHDMTFMRHRSLLELFGAHSEAGRHADEAFEVFYAARNRIELHQDVETALKRLRSRYRLFALSNGNADLQRCGIAQLFDGHISAIDAGAAKPDARIFEHLLRAARVDAAEVLHVGDDPHADVMGAVRAGMQAVWINRDAKNWPEELPPAPRTISTLAEII